MAHIVQCRACGVRFNRDKLIEGIDWVRPSEKQYYHKECFEQWAMRKAGVENDLTENGWYEALVYFLNREIKAPVDFKKLRSQWNNFLKQKKTAKGIYFSIRYYYDVLGGDKEKSQGGIGIVSVIYQESCEYWEGRYRHDHHIIEAIEQQAKEQMLQKHNLIIQKKKQTARKKAISLNDI